jgi:protein-disulfide isomerase
VLWIAGGIAALAAIGIILAVTLGGGKSKQATLPTVGSLTNGLPAATEVNRLLKGIPQNGLTLGNPSAPVTMVEYIDLQCPICQQFETQVMPGVVERYVRAGKVKVVARPLDFIGPDSSRGRTAMIAAGAQNKAFNFAQLLYDNQGTENTGWLSSAFVGQALASIPGMQVQQALDLQSAKSVQDKASEFDTLATSDQVGGTPTLFVGRSGTRGAEVTADEQSLDTAIKNALAS